MAEYRTAAGKTVRTGGLLNTWFGCTGCRERYFVRRAELESEAEQHAANCRRVR